ncbi:MAG: OmpH family outer membrane protein [Epsilonproteobacteria bacterium]|nr:OmpH family outer membrane protein [Campylobacterota bacterium]
MKTLTKATLATLALMSACSSSFATTSSQLVSLDSRYIFQNSKAGKAFIAKTQQKIDGFQETVRRAQQEVATMQEDIEKQRSVLSKDALTEKEEQLARKRKNSERDLTQQEEELRRVIQKDQVKLIEEQQKIYTKAAQEEGWSALIDKNTPGVIYVADAIDKSDYVLNKYIGASDDADAKTTMMVKKDATPASKAAIKTKTDKPALLTAKKDTKTAAGKTTTA